MPTGIEYIDHTLNFFSGCSPISVGCTRCWAKRMATRLRGRYGYPADNPFQPTIHPGKLEQLFKWKDPLQIGINFMSDTFHDEFMRMDAETDVIKQLFIAMMRADWHTYFLLTKRPQNMKKFFDNWIPPDIFENEPKRDHICLGVSVENQQIADERIPILLQIPAAVHWVSVEPMLGDIGLSRLWVGVDEGIDWVACGAETGTGARPMDLAWPRDLRDQCKAAGVPFYMKSVGEWAQCDGSREVWHPKKGFRTLPAEDCYQRVGKQPIPPDLMIREMPS